MKNITSTLINWVDAKNLTAAAAGQNTKSIAWLRVFPFISLHAACLGCIWTGVSFTALVVCIVSYGLRMFAITGFFHRYFSHKTFKTNRFWQFIFAFIGGTATQRGAIWWAAHHRHHHKNADKIEDVHSPKQHGFWWSHMGWFLSHAHFGFEENLVKDLMKYPELYWLNRLDIVAPLLFAFFLFYTGHFLFLHFPKLHTSGWQLVVWGYFISTVAVFHATSSINSMAHRFGKRDYNTADESRNNFYLALLTLGEGWHNNHHYYPGSSRQGLKWWQIDITFYLLYFLSKIRIIHNLRLIPEDLKK